MTASQLEQQAEARSGEVFRWRLDCLIRGGYDVETAVAIATEPGVDLHAALALVARGCPPATALRILA